MRMKDNLIVGDALIELSGFQDINNADMAAAQRIINNYVRKMEGICSNFSGLRVRLKPLHQTKHNLKKFELHAQINDNGHIYPAETVEHNLLTGVNSVCKKLVNEISG